jgi:MYXO-CTERM domain-containing protein
MGSVVTDGHGNMIECSPYNCQGDGKCRTTCASVNDCAAPNVCDGTGHCVVSSGNGDAGGSGGCAVTAARERGDLAAIGLLLALVFVRRVRRRRALT